MDVIELLQKLGYCVLSLFEEPGDNNWQIYIKEPDSCYSARAIVKEIQKLGYDVTKFDIRGSDFVIISFRQGTPTQDFILIGPKFVNVFTAYQPNEKVIYGKLSCIKLDCSGN